MCWMLKRMLIKNNIRGKERGGRGEGEEKRERGKEMGRKVKG